MRLALLALLVSCAHTLPRLECAAGDERCDSGYTSVCVGGAWIRQINCRPDARRNAFCEIQDSVAVCTDDGNEP